jgi:type IV pilus assembly protein PilQ
MVIIIFFISITPTPIYPDVSELLAKKISTNFQNTSLPDVLRILASQTNLNLVIGDDVSGRVTIQLSGVTLEDALNAILKSKGYHFITQNDIVLVKKFENDVNGELSNSVINLKYLDGFKLKTSLEPLLSEKGKLEALISQNEEDVLKQRSDILVVTDVWENVRTIETTLENMDVEPKQLEIEVRLIETLFGSNRQVGLNWPKKISASVTGGELTAPITQSTGGQQQETRKLSGWYQLPEIHDNITLGVLTVNELNASLELLAQDNNSKLISSPKLTTLDNKKAIIDVGTSVPVPEVSRGIGGDLISYREKQVSMYLEVIPRINEGNIITLTVHPILEEIIGYTGPSDYPQPITSRREVQTEVTVREF